MLKSISKSQPKTYSLYYHLESHLRKNRSLHLFTLQQVFYFLYAFLESYSRFLSLTNEKSEIEDSYMTKICIPNIEL
jgi:hypothetical protein